MARTIGIDLGTTYSAVSIAEERAGEGFYVLRGCPGFSILRDKLKNLITPSVVAENSKGELIVGYSAKARAGFSPEPIMFAKRWMGTNKTFRLDKQGELSVVEASAEIIKYLKKMAEDKLGETVDHVVITVPAYFSFIAKQMTKEAAMLAGFDEKAITILLEPVAAALMYSVNDPREDLRIMIYDLGGGTFDVAILRKKEGVISNDSVEAFGGDPMLGGYNFDETLAYWILDELNANGYNLPLFKHQENDPAVQAQKQQQDRVIWAKLMVYAERAKIALSKEDFYEFQEPDTGILDYSGNPVSIELSITKEDFEKMIEGKVFYTIQKCRETIEKIKPSITSDQIDEIILVGGSSRIPLIQIRLEETFKKKPLLIAPDLCVSLGAAVLAKASSTVQDDLGDIKIDPIPASTDLPYFRVNGHIVKGDQLPEVQGCKVILRATDGSYQATRTTQNDGKFQFETINLAPDTETEFILRVESPMGKIIKDHRFCVTQTSDVLQPLPGTALGSGGIQPVLSKPLSIEWVEGKEIFAPEGAILPFTAHIPAVTADACGKIQVRILEENNTLGAILITNVPKTLPIGSKVEVDVTIKENFEIHGRAYIPALGIEATTVIQIPIIQAMTSDELRRKFEKLIEIQEDVWGSALPGQLMRYGKRIKDLIAECMELFKSPNPDTAKIQSIIDEIENLINQLGKRWSPNPAKSLYDNKVYEINNLIKNLTNTKPELKKDGYENRLSSICIEAEKAYETENDAVWKDSNAKLDKLLDDLERLNTPITPPTETKPPSPEEELLKATMMLEKFKQEAEARGLYDDLKEIFEELVRALKRIDPNSPTFDIQLREVYKKLIKIYDCLNSPENEGLPSQGTLSKE